MSGPRVIRPGEPWGSPTVVAARPRGRRGRRRAGGRGARPRRARSCASVPTRRATWPARSGCAPGGARPTGGTGAPGRRARARRSATATASRATCACSARRPTGCAGRARRSSSRCALDGRPWFSGPATTVVVATGQFLRGLDLVPRGHPGDGKAEVQVYALRRAGAAARCAARLATGAHVPAPPDPAAHAPARSRSAAPGPLAARGRRRAAARPSPDSAIRGRARRVPAPDLSAPDRMQSPRDVDLHRYHQPSMLYAPEQFTDDEAATLRPYFTNLDGPVFALINLPEVVKGALFARYSRSDKSLRRLFLDEFVGDLDLTGDLTVDATVGLRARRGALRARVLRVRRRLRRAARRRAPRVRAGVEPAHEDPRVGPPHGVPRAVDALHPVRLARCTAATATSGRRKCASRRSACGTSPTSTASSTRTARCSTTMDGLGARALPEGTAPTPTSSTSRRSRPRRATRCAACSPRRRSRTSASTEPARRTKRCSCACARTRCPKRRSTRS